MISNKSSVEIVVIKGTFSGLGSLIVALVLGERIPAIHWLICVLFLGVAFSMLLLNERPGVQFYIALIIMIISTYFMVKDTIELQHTHEHTHVHTHLHTHTGSSEDHSHEHEIREHVHAHVV